MYNFKLACLNAQGALMFLISFPFLLLHVYMVRYFIHPVHIWSDLDHIWTSSFFPFSIFCYQDHASRDCSCGTLGGATWYTDTLYVINYCRKQTIKQRGYFIHHLITFADFYLPLSKHEWLICLLKNPF